MNKKLLIVSMLTITAFASYATFAKADDKDGAWHNQMVQTLSAKLGVSPDMVDSALTEVREQQRVERQVKNQEGFEDRLQELVVAGKLTQNQKDAWVAKHEEMIANSEAERKSNKEQLQTWLTEQGIDLELMRVGLRQGHRSKMMINPNNQ